LATAATETYRAIQHAILNRYDLHIDCQVEHFISHDNALVEQLTGQKNAAPEVLLVHEEGGNLDITLFLEKRLIESFNGQSSQSDAEPTFNDFCTILEGVSHFVYLVWNAQHGRQIKPVEMELQAEVDKFVFAALAENVFGESLNQKQIYDSLFGEVSFSHAPGTVLHDRYRIANYYAQQYCSWLSKHYQLSQEDNQLYAELARFYRMGATAKFDHIHLHSQ